MVIEWLLSTQSGLFKAPFAHSRPPFVRPIAASQLFLRSSPLLPILVQVWDSVDSLRPPSTQQSQWGIGLGLYIVLLPDRACDPDPILHHPRHHNLSSCFRILTAVSPAAVR